MGRPGAQGIQRAGATRMYCDRRRRARVMSPLRASAVAGRLFLLYIGPTTTEAGGAPVGLLDKLANPLKGLSDWQKQQAAAAAERQRVEEDQLRARREAYLNDLMEEFKEAERVEPKPYRELSVGEAKMGKLAAIEYFRNTGAIR